LHLDDANNHCVASRNLTDSRCFREAVRARASDGAVTPMTVSSVEPPPEAFNFAVHLLETNARRSAKTAFIDDIGALTYGQLDDRARRFATALKERGVKREERALILMQDGADWPVALLGSMLAGVVPVAVNTLLTADDLAYMLEHSRAQAVLVSGAVKLALKAALAKSDHEAHTVVVSRPAQPLEAGEIEFSDFLASATPLTKLTPTRADDPAFWLYSSGSTGRPKGTVHSHANPYWTTELYGKAILGLQESDVCF
jgi:benzoate-CoA ligase